MPKLLDAALAYAARGMSVIPLKPQDKRPLLTSWKDYQSKRMGVGDMRGFWKEQPDANIGLVTGAISGVTVVDVDGNEGVESLRDAGLYLPETYTVQTPKGFHYYYKYNNLFKTGAGFLKNVDVRNDKGYVVAPPSEVGNKAYSVIRDNGGEFAEFGVVPEQFLSSRKGTVSDDGMISQSNGNAMEPWIAQAITNGAPEGQRDETAIRLAGYFWSRGVPEDIIKATVTQFASNCTPPMSEQDVARVVRSATSYEQTKVRNFTEGKIPDPLCKITPVGDVEIVWPDNGVTIAFTQIYRTKERLACQIQVSTYNSGVLLGPVAFDMVSMSRRKEAVMMLKDRQAEDWSAILDVACRIARDAQDDTSEFIDLREGATQKSISPWLIDNFLAEGKPTIIYGDGGTGKSMMGVAVAMSIAGMVKVIDGLNPNTTGNVLYLDWETDEQEIKTRMDFIANGINEKGAYSYNLERGDFPVEYMRCTAPLVSLQPKISKKIEEMGCPLVIVDSLIPSLDGDANDSITATRLMNTLRSFGTASLIISHVSKEGKMFGSQFWKNMARNVWRVEKQQDLGQAYLDLSMVQEKSNNSGLSKPVGLRMNIENETASFTKLAIADFNVALAKSVPIKTRIIAELRTGAAQTVKDLADTLQETPSAVSMALTRGKGTAFVEITDAAGKKTWGLLVK